MAMIRDHLEEFLKDMTLNQFSELTQINVGTLSSLINGHRPIAMQQLDRITAGMDLPEGYFYELYIDECFFQAAPDWRRLGPFLQRCAELDKLDCIKKTVRLMMDNLSYIPVLFNLAEQFFHEDKWSAKKKLTLIIAALSLVAVLTALTIILDTNENQTSPVVFTTNGHGMGS